MNSDHTISLSTDTRIVVDIANSVDSNMLSNELAQELFKSPFCEKLKIISHDLCFGKNPEYNKFSIKIQGKVDQNDEERLEVLKIKFVEICDNIIKNKIKAKELIDSFWEVTYQKKFNTISDSFNLYGNKERIEHE